MVAVLLAQGFEEVEAVTPIDFIRRADIPVTVVGVGGREITGGHAITINADTTIEEFVPKLEELSLQAVVLPGGMPGAGNLADSPLVSRLLRYHWTGNGLVAAICAAPAVILEPLGILQNKKYTCYPSFADDVNSGEYQQKPVVVDGQLITARAAGSAAQFAGAIIANICNKKKSKQIMEATCQLGVGKL